MCSAWCVELKNGLVFDTQTSDPGDRVNLTVHGAWEYDE
jgi:hypothetical protein